GDRPSIDVAQLLETLEERPEPVLPHRTGIQREEAEPRYSSYRLRGRTRHRADRGQTEEQRDDTQHPALFLASQRGWRPRRHRYQARRSGVPRQQDGRRFHATCRPGSQCAMLRQGGRPMTVDRSHVASDSRELARLRALVGRLSDADLARPLEAGWTVAAVLAHVAFWDQRAFILLEGWRKSGLAAVPHAIDEADVDWIN